MIKDNGCRIKRTNLILIFLVVIITALPFFYHPHGSEFSGTDGQGTDLIQREHPDYQIWFTPIWQPPSGEVESLFFALQAAMGAGVLGYTLGYLQGKKQNRNRQGDVTVGKAASS